MNEIDEFICKNHVVIHLTNELPSTVRGCCYHDDDGQPIVLLNANLTIQQQRATLKHEIGHIARGEMDNLSYREYK